jgi:hypothetical protein
MGRWSISVRPEGEVAWLELPGCFSEKSDAEEMATRFVIGRFMDHCERLEWALYRDGVFDHSHILVTSDDEG